MKVDIMHNENMKTFNDLLHHLELEVEHLEVANFIQPSLVCVGKSLSVTKIKMLLKRG